MSNHNENNVNRLPENALPVTAATTNEAKATIEELRSFGVDDSQMAIVRDFAGGTEEVLINKPGIVTAAQGEGVNPYDAIKALNEGGVPLSLDEELAIVTGSEAPETTEESEAELEVKDTMCETTLGQLLEMMNATLKTSFPIEFAASLGGRKHREYLADNLRRFTLRYGKNITIADVLVKKKDARVVAVAMNALGMGEPNVETINKMEKEIASQF